MNRKQLKILLVCMTALLVLALLWLAALSLSDSGEPEPSTEAPPETTAETTVETTVEETTVETTQAPTTEPEPTEERFLLTFVGDCTLGSTKDKAYNASSFIKTIGEDYSFPFAKVVSYFENDDFTMVNLEGVLAEGGTAADKTFAFIGPTAYTNILTGSSVEAVTLANNHTQDFGAAGYESTKNALDAAGVAYAERNSSMLFTTESGLTIGVYAAAFTFDTGDMKAEIAQLRENGAEIVICAFHWGTEGSYRVTSAQTTYGRAAIDAGADIVYGHHPHVLQKIEEYNGGIICYSLGNFSFGGNSWPRDRDSAILQQEVIRDPDGTVRLGELTIIPVCITSTGTNQNNFQPMPYEEGTKEYDRVLSKLDGSFTGPDLTVDYSGTTETTAPVETTPETAPPATEPPAAEAPATEPSTAEPPATEAPAQPENPEGEE